MQRLALASLLSLTCLSSHAATLYAGHFAIANEPSGIIQTATAYEVVLPPVHFFENYSIDTVVYSTTLPPRDYDSGVTITISDQGFYELPPSTPLTAVPLSDSAIYFAGALLPLIARWLRKRR